MFHEIASIFPLMGDDEIQDLADDIREHGLRQPIIRFEGKVLDGRNRATACKLAGIEPEFEDFAGDALQAVAFVWSENYHRRHLNSSQAALAEDRRVEKVEAYRSVVESMKKEAAQKKKNGKPVYHTQEIAYGENESTSQRTVETQRSVNGQRAKAAGTNRTYLDDVKRIRAEAPDLEAKIEAGEMKISQAKLELARRKKHEELQKAEAQEIETSWRIVNEDCLNAFDLEEPKSVRLIVADPPYNIGIDYGRGASADKLPEKDYLAWCDDWIERCYETLTADGSLWVIISDEYAAEIAVALKEYGFHRRAWIKWYETFGVNCANNFNRCTRHIFYCVKDAKKFVFHDEAVRSPSARQTKYNDKRANPAGKIWDDLWQIPRLTGTCQERIPDFPTQLPLDLVRPIVRCASHVGDTVLDPFCGSGTTGVAAIEARRNFVGYEWEDRFCDLAELRLKGTGHDSST